MHRAGQAPYRRRPVNSALGHMNPTDDWLMLREGTWLYAGSVEVAVRLRLSPSTWGSGDYEDEQGIANDSQETCVFIEYEAAGTPGVFCNLIPNLKNEQEAVLEAERKFPGIRWIQGTCVQRSQTQ